MAASDTSNSSDPAADSPGQVPSANFSSPSEDVAEEDDGKGREDVVAETDVGEELEVLVADEADAAAAASKGNFLMATSKEIMGNIVSELGRRYHSGGTSPLEQL